MTIPQNIKSLVNNQNEIFGSPVITDKDIWQDFRTLLEFAVNECNAWIELEEGDTCVANNDSFRMYANLCFNEDESVCVGTAWTDNREEEDKLLALDIKSVDDLMTKGKPFFYESIIDVCLAMSNIASVFKERMADDFK